MSNLSEEDKKLLQQAMKGVVPLKVADPRTHSSPSKPTPRVHSIYPEVREKSTEPTLLFYDNDEEQPETIFFARPGLQYRVQLQLRQGKMRPQVTLDLHGMRVDEARRAVAQFLERAFRQGLRHLIIIHGKGGHGNAVLRGKVYQWLPQSPKVLAFSSAIPRDGGSGAVYILLAGH